ncbi:hypothetical protein PNA2_1739 [Pyrococcus sp. NA2]|uniref:hypothetical protein n=1 Tax=Pyrococcus sp. (strain NA2) TaxID=342949 RepID=UPI000209AB25|nr:hypothetical protein [Pyrococcus sp. NA2]AEC52654.1 hypothetical protein PNA2_1739 [Pyrococcus sp. NA2]
MSMIGQLRISITLLIVTFLIATLVSAEWMSPRDRIAIVLIDEEGKVLRGFSGDYEIQVQVDVATPSGIKTLGHYRIKRTGIWKLDTTRSVVKVVNLREALPRISREKRYGVRISVWIIDRENSILYRGIGSTLLSAEDLSGTTKRVSVTILEKESLPKPGHEGWYYYEWRPADDSWEARDYVKVPLLIIDNRNGKGRLQGSISLEGTYKTEFSATLAYGIDLETKFKNDDPVRALSSSVTIYGKKWVPIEGYYYFYRSVDVPKGKIGHIYIWAKPYYRHEKEYLCAGGMGTYGCSETGKERIDVGIYDVKALKGVNGYIMEGGYEVESPELDSRFYKFIKDDFQHLLSRDDGISLRYLFKGIGGDCGVKFGIGIPVGAIAVAFGAPAPVAGLVASVQYEKAGSVSVDGGIQNYGPSITLHAFKSSQKYKFRTDWFSSCSVEVPMGFYVKSE